MSKGTYSSVYIIGNLGSDPEITYTTKGTAVAKFSVATTETFNNQDGEPVTRTDWHNAVLWAGLADIAKNHLKKGNKIHLQGRIEYQSWDDKQTGEKRYKTVIIASDMTMLGLPPRAPEDKERAAYEAAYGITKGTPLAVTHESPTAASAS